MNNLFNQTKYLERINYSGSISPTLQTLTNLQTQHLLNIPFENLDIHYNNTITLDIDKIYKKIIQNSRGGFCYEANGLFYKLLMSIGFDATMVSARVFKDNTYGKEFDHLTIVVNIDNKKYLTDVGFGEFSFSPLCIELNTIQNDLRGNFVFDHYDDKYLRVNKIEEGKKTPEYIFTTQPRMLKDFEQMCTFQQTSPESNFVKKKLITIPTKNGRITLNNNLLKIKTQDSIQELPLKNDKEFEQQLWKYFKVKIS